MVPKILTPIATPASRISVEVTSSGNNVCAKCDHNSLAGISHAEPTTNIGKATTSASVPTKIFDLIKTCCTFNQP